MPELPGRVCGEIDIIGITPPVPSRDELPRTVDRDEIVGDPGGMTAGARLCTCFCADGLAAAGFAGPYGIVADGPLPWGRGGVPRV
jgi:hypothetical protein